MMLRRTAPQCPEKTSFAFVQKQDVLGFICKVKAHLDCHAPLVQLELTLMQVCMQRFVHDIYTKVFKAIQIISEHHFHKSNQVDCLYNLCVINVPQW